MPRPHAMPIPLRLAIAHTILRPSRPWQPCDYLNVSVSHTLKTAFSTLHCDSGGRGYHPDTWTLWSSVFNGKI